MRSLLSLFILVGACQLGCAARAAAPVQSAASTRIMCLDLMGPPIWPPLQDRRHDERLVGETTPIYAAG
jgi:hypothetical protein